MVTALSAPLTLSDDALLIETLDSPDLSGRIGEHVEGGGATFFSNLLGCSHLGSCQHPQERLLQLFRGDQAFEPRGYLAIPADDK